MVEETKSLNEQIKDWSDLKSTTFDLYVDIDLIDIQKLIDVLGLTDEQAKSLFGKTAEPQEAESSNAFNFSLLYKTSLGTFKQKQAAGSVKFKQNSALSLSVLSNYKLKVYDYTIATKASYSQVNTSSADKFIDNFSVDPEIGAAIHVMRDIESIGITAFSGFDYERFNTFNFDSIVDNQTVSFDKNSFIYLTVGVKKSFIFYSRNFNATLSYSHTVFSRRSFGYNSTINKEEFKGSKVIAYADGEITKKIFGHAIFESYLMDGYTELRIYRFGLGLGYNF